jgi:hypothetical protein
LVIKIVCFCVDSIGRETKFENILFEVHSYFGPFFAMNGVLILATIKFDDDTAMGAAFLVLGLDWVGAPPSDM